MLSMLIRFPADILLLVITEWLWGYEWCRLDSSFTNCYRKAFLALSSKSSVSTKDQFMVTINLPISLQFEAIQCLIRWMKIRDLRVTEYRVDWTSEKSRKFMIQSLFKNSESDFEQNKYVTSLALENCEISNVLNIVAKFPNMKHLHIVQEKRIFFTNLFTTRPSLFANLQSISLSACTCGDITCVRTEITNLETLITLSPKLTSCELRFIISEWWMHELPCVVKLLETFWMVKYRNKFVRATQWVKDGKYFGKLQMICEIATDGTLKYPSESAILNSVPASYLPSTLTP